MSETSIGERCEKCNDSGLIPVQGWAWRDGDPVSYPCACPAGRGREPEEQAEVPSVEQRFEALKARLRQEVDAHRMTLHVRALPFTDEEWQGYLGTIPGLEEER